MGTKIFLYGSIDLTKISPKITSIEDLSPEARRMAKKAERNGHIYLSVNISDSREPTDWSSHFIAASARGEKALSIGNLKEYIRNNANVPTATQQEKTPEKTQRSSYDEMPF